MKNKLQISALCFSAIALLICFYPFRTAICKIPGEIDSSVEIGPRFILSNPSKKTIYEAIFEDSYTAPSRTLKASLQSKIDYGRTILFLFPFATGAIVSLLWMRKIQ